MGDQRRLVRPDHRVGSLVVAVSNDLDEFLTVLRAQRDFLDNAWEDDEAFSWVAQRTWIKWWAFEDTEDVREDAPVRPRRVGAALTRVYVEQAGPEMRAHP